MRTFLRCVGIVGVLLGSGQPISKAGSLPVPVSFKDNGQKLGDGSSWNIQLVDLNGDGRLDAYFDRATWLNDGSGQFTKSDLSFCSQSARTWMPAYFADVNGDGYVDALCDDTVYLNDGKFHFEQRGVVPTDIPMISAQLADLNQDGRVDMIVAGQYEDRILLNDGKGNFIDTKKGLGGWGQATYAIGDINGDGIPDVYVGIPHTPPPNMVSAHDRLWLGDGKGGFSEAALSIDNKATRGVVLADLNGDGSLDLFLTSQAGGSRVYLNDGKGKFTDTGQLLGTGPGGMALVADFNGDGFPDVFVARGRPTDHGIPNLLWLNDGTGHFRDSGLQLGNGNSVAAAVGDLNGDGKPDLFAANVKNITSGGNGLNEVWLNVTNVAPQLTKH